MGTGGFAHPCGLRTDGSAWCWGLNSRGQLGNGTYTDAVTPQQVVGGSDWISLSSGQLHSCGVRSDHTAWCWGNNERGELGVGAFFVAANTPQQVGTDSNWASLSAGSYFTCGLRIDGTLWCWGSNLFGELGSGTGTGAANTPQQVGSDADWVSLNVGSGGSACAVRTDGTAWCWGADPFGSLLGNGMSTNTAITTPQRVGSDSNWLSLSPSAQNNCGLRADGTAWCWGGNSQGQVGDGTNTDSYVPVPVAP
jgi:alpha-tubulin suppressor-like RCC1 family protein